jgi:hypothetical protein
MIQPKQTTSSATPAHHYKLVIKKASAVISPNATMATMDHAVAKMIVTSPARPNMPPPGYSAAALLSERTKQDGRPRIPPPTFASISQASPTVPLESIYRIPTKPTRIMYMHELTNLRMNPPRGHTVLAVGPGRTFPVCTYWNRCSRSLNRILLLSYVDQYISTG